MKKLLSFTIAALTCLLPAHAQVNQGKTFQKIVKINVTLEKVDVRIIPSAGIDVKVRERDPRCSNLELIPIDGVLTIRQIQVDHLSNCGKLEIEVPENLNFAILMSTGTVAIDHVKGNFQVYSKSGDINATVTPTGASHFESESGSVLVKLDSRLTTNLHVGAGSGRGIVDFSSFPVNAKLTMDSFYRSGTIKAPFEFKEVHVTRSYGPDSIVKKVDLGSGDLDVSLSTGGGTIEVIM